MENNADIEQLFKNSFDDFEADVHPDAWTNIQNGLQPLAHAASSNGVSAATKVAAVSTKFGTVAIIGSAIAVISITAVIYFSSETKEPVETGLKETIATDNNKIISTENNLQVSANKNAEQQSFSSLNSSESAKTKISGKHISGKIHEKKQADIYLSSADNSIAVIPIASAISDNQNKTETKTPPAINQQAQPPKTIINDKETKGVEQTNEETGNENSDLKSTDVKQEPAKTVEDVLGKITDVITPNQDGMNDVFVINGNDLQVLKVSIFDRAEKLIHQWNNLHGFWDGKSANGQEAVAGIYFYDIFAQTSDGKIFTKKGTLHLLRK